MKVYLLNILFTNDIEELMKDEMAQLFKKHNAMLYNSSPEEAQKYLCQLMFEKREDRESLADEIPQIAFEYTDMDYPDELYRKVKNGEIKVDLNPKPKNHKPTEQELKIDAWLERNEYKNVKMYFDAIVYEIWLPNKKKAVIQLDYRAKWVVGGVKNGIMVSCNHKSQIENALAKLLEEIDKASVSIFVS